MYYSVKSLIVPGGHPGARSSGAESARGTPLPPFGQLMRRRREFVSTFLSFVPENPTGGGGGM